MPTIKPIGTEIFNDYSAAINKCRKELVAQDWFADGWWLNVAFNGGGFVFQLSKLNWYNHNGKGIHFEFWIDEHEVETQSVPIVLHFEPETPDRKALGYAFEAAFAGMESQFADYRVNHNAICDKLQKREKLTKSGLHKLVVREFTRLQALGPVIDGILS